MTLTDEKKAELAGLLKEAQQIHQKEASLQNEVAKRAPAVVDALVKAGMVTETNRSTVVENLKDPLKVLESLRKSAEYCAAITAKQAEASKATGLGKADDMNKVASAAPAKSRRDEADEQFLAQIGLR